MKTKIERNSKQAIESNQIKTNTINKNLIITIQSKKKMKTRRNLSKTRSQINKNLLSNHSECRRKNETKKKNRESSKQALKSNQIKHKQQRSD